MFDAEHKPSLRERDQVFMIRDEWQPSTDVINMEMLGANAHKHAGTLLNSDVVWKTLICFSSFSNLLLLTVNTPRFFFLHLQSEADSQTGFWIYLSTGVNLYSDGDGRLFLDRWWQKEEEETEPQGRPGNTTITFLIHGTAKSKIMK